MKKLLLTILTLFSMNYAFCQAKKSTIKLPIDESSKLITYLKDVDRAGIVKDTLFEKVISWAKEYYKNPYDVIREQNKDAGKIVCKSRYKIVNPPDKKGFSSDAGLVQYTLTFQITDSKIKCTLSEINWKQTSYYACEKWMDTSNQYYKTEFEYYLEQVDNNSKQILKSLDKSIH